VRDEVVALVAVWIARVAVSTGALPVGSVFVALIERSAIVGALV
jgi:hypothetical protein